MVRTTGIIIIIILSNLINTAMGVDRSKFKNCEQSSFCQRHRQNQRHNQEWVLHLNTLSSSQHQVSAELYDAKDSNSRLLMVLSLTKMGAIRMKIDELNSKRARFEALDALDPELKFVKLEIERQDKNQVSFLFGAFLTLNDLTHPEAKRKVYRLTLNVNPFKATVTNLDDQVIMIANGQGLFRFERYQELEHQEQQQSQQQQELGMPSTSKARAYDAAGKPIEPDEGTETASDTQNLNVNEEGQEKQQVSYQESFSTFTDSRPYGPMSVGMDIHYPTSEFLYGIPEHADHFALRDTRPNIGDPYRLYNVDIFEYELYTPMSLYGSIPMIISHSSEVGTFGLYWLNPSDTWIDIESENSAKKSGSGVVGMISNFVASTSIKGRLTHWFSETGLVDIWFMPGPDPQTVMSFNAEVFGTIPLPPMYSIGFHQSRWNYYSSDEVMQVQDGFNEADIPLDAIWLDVEYTSGRSKRYFTWDPVSFPDPVQLARNLTEQGRRLVAIIDPHIKKEIGYELYDEGTQMDLWIKDPSGNNPYDGWCWPGSSVWPDYLLPQVREWWAQKFAPEYFPGDSNTIVDIWNDMNEPSVFSGPEVTAPRDLRHAHGFEHRDLHNMYGFLMTKATYEGMAKYRGHLDRPFVLTRSFFAGSQRYCAAWTGDNKASWDHLQATIPMLLSLSVAGMPFVGADVGGFFGNPESEELLVRWHQAGAFQPFFRAHAHQDSRRREAYLYTGETRKLLRDAIRLRSFYAPYWYTLFFESNQTGMPIIRPHWFSDPQDLNTFEIEDQYSLGSALLVKPVMHKSATSIDVYLPGLPDSHTQWFDFSQKLMRPGGKTVKDLPVSLATIPIFQRAGSIVPRHNIARRSLKIGSNDPITLDIVLNTHNDTLAQGRLYLESQEIYIEISYINEILHVRPLSINSHSGYCLIERIVIYNWPSEKNILSINSMSSAQTSPQTQVDFFMSGPKQDKTSQLEIRKPQQSPDWLDWKLVIVTS